MLSFNQVGIRILKQRIQWIAFNAQWIQNIVMTASAFIPNSLLLKNLVIQDLKESALNIENSKILLVLDVIEARNISTSENGGLLNFVNNRNINITNICCSCFDSTGNGLFLYISTPETVHASFLSLSSSPSPKSVYGIYSTGSNFTSLNISKVGRCALPGLYSYGAKQGKSYVKFYTVADSHTNNNFVDESTNGEQAWTSINGVNCSSPVTIFKVYSHGNEGRSLCGELEDI